MSALTLGLPSAASATEVGIFNGWMFDTSGTFGPRHSLTSVWTTQYQGVPACINALISGGGWAGATRCTTPSDTNIGHNYCACDLKYGWGAPSNSQGSSAYWREFY